MTNPPSTITEIVALHPGAEAGVLRPHLGSSTLAEVYGNNIAIRNPVKEASQG